MANKMVNQLKAYDKTAAHIIRIKTEDYNRILSELGGALRVVPRDEALDEDYQIYLQSAKIRPPVPKEIYEERYFIGGCVFENKDGPPAEIQMEKLLGVKSLFVSYAKDRFGYMTNDTLEIRYKVG